MKTYGGVDIRYVATYLVLVGAEWSHSRPCRFTRRGKRSHYPLERRIGRAQKLSGIRAEGKICSPFQKSNQNSSAIQAAAWSLHRPSSLGSSTECSTCRLIIRPERCIYRQTEGHSFCDHLISESVSVTPSSVIEASIMLCSVSV
jgi:hypothetical protein